MKSSLTHIKENEVLRFRRSILSAGSDLFERYPWRLTANKYHAIVAELMLQRTRVQQVLPIYEEFVSKCPDAQSFIEMNRMGFNPFNSLGLSWRIGSLINLSEYISEHGIPRSKDELMKIKGIGDYVASAYTSFHLNQRVVLIDSNIVRLISRYFSVPIKGELRRNKVFKDFVNVILPKRNYKAFNYGILDLSMKICSPIPKCNICHLNRNCLYQKKS